MTRSILWVLLPACIVYALLLVSQGVVQNFKPYDTAKLIESQQVQKTGTDGKPMVGPDGKAVMDTVTDQTIAQGPVASQEAIKMLGTNGGGFFNANSSHPFENPTPLSNLLQMFSIFAIPAGLTYTLGRMTGSPRHGWAVWAAMAFLFLCGVSSAYWAEARGNPLLHGVDQRATALQSGGNMEGKEVRFGIADSALFATVTTDASCGAINGVHDSYTPLGGMVPLVNIMLSETVFGGVGAGLYGILIYVVLSVFIAGLMVGRTPEYLGKKIEAYDVKMAMLVTLVFPADYSRAHGHFNGQGIWHLEHHQSRAPRPDADPLRVHVHGGKQRFRIRRFKRQHALVQHRGRDDHAGRPFLHDHSDAGDCRQPGEEESGARFGGHIPGNNASVFASAGVGDRDRRSADIFPGSQSRART